jgi:O-antigen ligase/polysaccharide polymerase Wzy-like membrane protein
MAHEDLAQLAALVGAAGVALVLLLPRRVAVAAGVALLAAAEAMFGLALAESTLRTLFDEPAGIVLVAVGAAGVAVLGVVFARNPAIVPVALLAAAPFRIPVEVANEKAFLLLPLYGVLASAALAALVGLARRPEPAAIPRFLTLPVTAFVALTAVSLTWSHDVRVGSIALAFFYLPFALGFAIVARSPLAPWLPRALAATLVSLSTVFAVIGLWQARSHRLFFAPDLEVANAYTTFFRVTSVFKDPSLYGRYLVAAIAVLLVGLWMGRARAIVVLPLTAILFAGLQFSYSQSSFVALFAVVLGIALVLGGPRLRTTLAAGVAIAVVAAGTVTAASVADEGWRHATSGRSRLVSVTLDVVRAYPIAGVGVGGQPRASVEQGGTGPVKRNASHTTPLTVAAELGAIGLALYAWLLVAGALALLRVTFQARALGLSLAAVGLILVVHSLFYAGFFEDPLTWGVLAVSAAALSVPVAARREDEPLAH